MSRKMPWLNPASRFPETRASVLERVKSAEPEVRREAFGQIVTGYWKPVYKYLRLKWGLGDEDAADATQGFLSRAFEKDFFDTFKPSRARFRTFLRVCVDRFVMNERQAASAQRRGGGAQAVPLDFALAEAELSHHEVAGDDPDRLFHQEMLRDLVGRTLNEVRQECEQSRHGVAFRAFERYDIEPPDDLTYAALARELDIPVTQVTNYLAAVRRMFRTRVLANLREMSGSDAEFRADARELFGVEVR
ncbi:MAG: hypothetical protein Q8S13_05650 [Dehalococcoidia bacterium]|nr:hypothetical protein [Dehalococcoidia bacterium]